MVRPNANERSCQFIRLKQAGRDQIQGRADNWFLRMEASFLLRFITFFVGGPLFVPISRVGGGPIFAVVKHKWRG